jgi:hypothetical protein
MTIDAIQRDKEIRERAGSADLVVTFVNRHKEVSGLLPNTKVVSIRFIPSEATRLALASLDPMARVVVVSRFPDFLPIIKSGVQRFAAHVQDITAVNIDDPQLDQSLACCDVAVFSTGAETVATRIRPGTQSIEYRHNPDPGDVERVVMPFVTMSAEAAALIERDAS